ncbi:hypothetical protein Hanom_Chr04g00314261 [Helianthus anomalus]
MKQTDVLVAGVVVAEVVVVVVVVASGDRLLVMDPLKSPSNLQSIPNSRDLTFVPPETYPDFCSCLCPILDHC